MRRRWLTRTNCVKPNHHPRHSKKFRRSTEKTVNCNPFGLFLKIINIWIPKTLRCLQLKTAIFSELWPGKRAKQTQFHLGWQASETGKANPVRPRGLRSVGLITRGVNKGWGFQNQWAILNGPSNLKQVGLSVASWPCSAGGPVNSNNNNANNKDDGNVTHTGRSAA